MIPILSCMRITKRDRVCNAQLFRPSKRGRGVFAAAWHGDAKRPVSLVWSMRLSRDPASQQHAPYEVTQNQEVIVQ